MDIYGIDGSVTINGQADTNELISGISVTISKTMSSKKRKNSAWEKFTPGRFKTFPLSFDMDWDPSHPICKAVSDSFWNNDVLTVVIKDRVPPQGATGAEASCFTLTGKFIVENFANNQSNLEEGQTYAVSLKLAYGETDPTFNLVSNATPI